MEYDFNNICTLREPCHTVAQNLHNLFLSPKAYLNGSTLLLPVTELLFLSSFLCNVAVIIYSLLFLCTPFYTSRYPVAAYTYIDNNNNSDTDKKQNRNTDGHFNHCETTSDYNDYENDTHKSNQQQNNTKNNQIITLMWHRY